MLYLLSQITGDDKYAKFAEAYLDAAMNLTDEKGFFWWGWHRFYDVFDDKMSGSNGDIHEIHIIRPRWDILWNHNPKTTRKELENIWRWHIVDKNTGEHNRHGDGQKGCDFVMSAGEFIYALALLYTKTGDETYYKGARLVADYHWRHQNPDTNLTPNRPNAGKDRFDDNCFDTSITGILCYYLLKTYELISDDVFRDQALAYLRAYAKYGYDRNTGRFWGSLRLDGTAVPGPRINSGYGRYEPRGHIDLWEPYQLGYEYPIYTAQVYAYAYQLTGERLMLETAKKWARWIERAPPSHGCLVSNGWYERYAKLFAPHGTYADMYGRSISFFVHMYALTGQESYLYHAQGLAREAVSKLYYNGLFRGHPAKPYYGAVDGVGFLLYGLLQLDCAVKYKEDLKGAKAIPLKNAANNSISFDNW